MAVLTHFSSRGRLLLAVLCLLLLPAWPGMALEIPQLRGRVNDYAGMLAPATVQQLENSLNLFEAAQSTQIVILTVTSLAGDSLEDFSLRAAEAWQIGQKGKDNGALLVISKNDRKMRIEVGYGLEGSLTDLTAGRIIRDVITPQFRNGNFDQGVINGATAMMAAVKGEFTADQPRTSSGSIANNDPGGLIVPLLIGLFFVGRLFGKHRMLTATTGAVAAPLFGIFALGFQWLIILALIPIGFIAGLVLAAIANAAGSGRSGGPWVMGGGGFGGSSGGFGGGFSGGGGGFGGGGASGGW